MRILLIFSVISIAYAQAPAQPTDVQGWLKQGFEAAKAGRQEDAAKAMNAALQLDPDNLPALHTLAWIHFNSRRLPEARATYEKILTIAPDGKEAHYGLAAVAATEVETARQKARAESGMKPGDPGPIQNAAKRFDFQNQFATVIDEAIRHLEQSLQQDPKFVPALAYMSQLHRSKADYAADAAAYKEEITRAEEWAAEMPPSAHPSATTAPGQIRVGGDVQAAKLVRNVPPMYPPLALQARIQGTVRFNIVIGKDGRILNMTLLSGHPLLVPAATEALKQWEYQPTLLNGKAVEVVTQADVNFKL